MLKKQFRVYQCYQLEQVASDFIIVLDFPYQQKFKAVHITLFKNNLHNFIGQKFCKNLIRKTELLPWIRIRNRIRGSGSGSVSK